MYYFPEAKGAGTLFDLPRGSRGGAGQCGFALYYAQHKNPGKKDKTPMDPFRFYMAAEAFNRQMKTRVPGIETRIFSFSTEPEFADAWARIVAWAAGRTVAVGGMFNHSDPEGIYSVRRGTAAGHDGTITAADLAGLARLNWSSQGLLVLCGCQSGIVNPGTGVTLADRMAKQQGVTVLGQRGKATFSSKWESHRSHDTDDENVCLWAYARGQNEGWSGDRIPGYIARVHKP
jgi:hypothetical protein